MKFSPLGQVVRRSTRKKLCNGAIVGSIPTVGINSFFFQNQQTNVVDYVNSSCFGKVRALFEPVMIASELNKFIS